MGSFKKFNSLAQGDKIPWYLNHGFAVRQLNVYSKSDFLRRYSYGMRVTHLSAELVIHSLLLAAGLYGVLTSTSLAAILAGSALILYVYMMLPMTLWIAKNLRSSLE